MNLILIQPWEWPHNDNQGEITLQDQRHHHIYKIIKAKPGDSLRVGLLNGMMGRGDVIHIDKQAIRLQVTLDTPPPKPLPVTLLLALPRPRVLQRTMQACATLGVKDIFLINTQRVEKSYWHTPLLADDTVQQALFAGLEQGRDTLLPNVYMRQRFKPFVEDELPNLIADKQAWVAHPMADAPACPSGVRDACVLAVGPEGGFVPYEIQQLAELGFTGIQLGPRILKVETAIPALLGKLFL